MDHLLTALRAAAEPTRLRLLALAGRGEFCVSDFIDILGQSQPRVSRHLKLLCDSGLLLRVPEGAHVWFALPAGPDGTFVRDLLARLPVDDPMLAADRRQAARVLSERARAASESFRRQGADWDEMRALDLPAEAVEQALLSLLPVGSIGRLIDIGTGTGRLLELLGPRVAEGVGIDASRAMLALARTRLSRAGLAHCTVRLGDMYRLPVADSGFDLALLQMVLHHAEDPAGTLAEAARVLRPGGLLLVVELAQHDQAEIARHFAHRWHGFSELAMRDLLASSGFEQEACRLVRGVLDTRLWSARRPAHTASESPASSMRPALNF
ncbi:MAG: metalloregulator ArsR/SmtB family transcription factor [Alphaproteobacteria bacterium]|nr:metalloregulator ArsR/SmtB family transcription factor [Alphaproteobacteria bacterium]